MLFFCLQIKFHKVNAKIIATPFRFDTTFTLPKSLSLKRKYRAINGGWGVLKMWIQTCLFYLHFNENSMPHMMHVILKKIFNSITANKRAIISVHFFAFSLWYFDHVLFLLMNSLRSESLVFITLIFSKLYGYSIQFKSGLWMVLFKSLILFLVRKKKHVGKSKIFIYI